MVDRLDPDLGARLLLAPDVERRGLVLADEHGGEPDRPPQRRHVARHLGAHLRGEGLPVHQGRSHGA